MSAAILIVAGILVLGAFDATALPGCESCHLRGDFRTATAASPHAKVDCRSCHVPAGPIGRLGFVLGQPLHMLAPLSKGAERDAAAVPDSRCLTCHRDAISRVVTANGVRIAHSSCAVGASCTDCHSEVAHGEATSWVRVYQMDRCLSCHIGKAKTACDLCHQGRDKLSRIDSPTFAVTHGPQWRSTHGMGDGATCVVCHSAADCAKCHGPGVPHTPGFVQVHTQFARKKDAKCSGCHDASFCDACHGTQMPHPAKFQPEHPKIAARKPEMCKRCHEDSDCNTCHEKHVHPGGAVGGPMPTKGADH